MSAAQRPPLTVTRDGIRAEAERTREGFSEAELEAWTDRTWDRVQELDEGRDVDVCRAADRGEAAADILFQSWPPERRRKAAAAADAAWRRSWEATKPGRRRR